MKTAEEIIKEFNKFEIESFDHHPINALSFEDCEKAMKLYANQKLDEAANNLKQTAGQWNADYNNEINKILSLKENDRF